MLYALEGRAAADYIDRCREYLSRGVSNEKLTLTNLFEDLVRGTRTFTKGASALTSRPSVDAAGLHLSRAYRSSYPRWKTL